MKKILATSLLAAALGFTILAQALLGKDTQPLSATAMDGRFIAYDNGTVLDTTKKLMWAARDNGSDITWTGAESYCKQYRGGGYKDWRMPMPSELAELFDREKSQTNEANSQYRLHLTELIVITSSLIWAEPRRGTEGATFNFRTAYGLWLPVSDSYNFRALPVRHYR